VAEVPIDFDKETFDKALAVCGNRGEAEGGQLDEEEEEERRKATTMGRLLHTYFDNQLVLFERIRPEVIGHFDLVRLWNPKLDFRSYEGVWDKVERNVRFGIGYGALFEVNAASFRKRWEEGYPAWDVLEVSCYLLTRSSHLALKLEIWLAARIVHQADTSSWSVQLIISLNGRLCLSDDSHGPLAVGLNYHRLYSYLRSHSVDELWYLSLSSSSEAVETESSSSSKSSVQPERDGGGQREERRRSGRVTPKRVEGKWWKDEFWMSRKTEEA
jgi:histidinol-phosphatase (PHP family)